MPLTEKQFKILLNPVLLEKWLALNFSMLRPALLKCLDKESVDEICSGHSSSVDKKIIEKFHRQVIQKDNEHLYMDIVNFCKEKCLCIADFIDVMSMIWDNDENEDETILFPKRRREETTSVLKQRHSALNEKLEFCLNKNTIVNLLRKYSDVNERENDALLNNLIRQNKEFHDEVLMLLKEENEKYQDCYKFMEHVELFNNVEVASTSSGFSRNKDVVSLTKLQLEINQLKEKFNNLRNKNKAKGDFSSVLPMEIATSTSSCQIITLAIDYSIGCLISYSEYKVPASQTLLDLKRKICANCSQFNKRLSPRGIKLIHRKTLLVGNNMTLQELRLVEHSSIECIIGRNFSVIISSSSSRKMCNEFQNNKCDNNITVFVQDEENKRKKLKVNKNDTVLWLKAEYSEKTGRLLENMKLFCKGKEMSKDESTIDFYGVKNDSILSLSK